MGGSLVNVSTSMLVNRLCCFPGFISCLPSLTVVIAPCLTSRLHSITELDFNTNFHFGHVSSSSSAATSYSLKFFPIQRGSGTAEASSPATLYSSILETTTSPQIRVKMSDTKPNPEGPCSNCGSEGHWSCDCPWPEDWSRVQCSNCEQLGSVLTLSDNYIFNRAQATASFTARFQQMTLDPPSHLSSASDCSKAPSSR